MHILIPGGSGLVGSRLAVYLNSLGHQVYVLTHRQRIKNNLNFPIAIQVLKMGADLPEIDCIINLAGERISTYPLSSSRMNKLIDSRLNVINYLKNYYQNKSSQILFLQASATGIYQNTHAEINCPIADNIYSKMCQQIEDQAQKAFAHCALLRLGVVVGQGGGLVSLLRFIPKIQFISARNYIPYILNDDLAKAIALIIEHKLTGKINLCSDKYLTVNELLSLCQNHHPRINFYLPKFILKLDKRGQLLLVDQKIRPQRLLDLNFKFS